MACKCCVPPGLNTFDPNDMHILYDAMVAQGLGRFLFYDGSVRSAARFAETALSGAVWTYAGFSRESGEPLALALVEPFSGRAAFMHFAFFRGMGHERRHVIGRAILRLLFQDSDNGLSCVCGLTPKIFRHAWRFALELGFVKLGELPGACPVCDAKTGAIRHVPGVLTMYAPERDKEVDMGGIFGGSKPKVQQVQAPVVAAAAPEPEETAEAPVVDEGAKRKTENRAKRKGTSALRIDLSIGGGDMGGSGGSSGLSIPK